MNDLFEINGNLVALKQNELRSAYYNDGALIVRELLPMELIEDVAIQIITLIELIDSSLTKSCLLNFDNPVKKASWMLLELEHRQPGSQSVVYDAIAHTPLMHKIAANSELMKVLRIILSPNLLIHPRLIVLMSMPASTWHLARWHQDFYYNGYPENTCTVYAPLQYTNSKNGGLIIAKHSLHNGALNHNDYKYDEPTKWKTIEPKIVNTFDKLAQIKMQAGDVLFFHSLTAHTAQVNKSDDVRFVINLRYRDMLDEHFRFEKWRATSITDAREALSRKNP
jgi:phytanoyl-CoA hydroxylase